MQGFFSIAIVKNNIPRDLRTRESIDLTASWAETETSSSEGGKRLINGKSRKFEDGIEIARKSALRLVGVWLVHQSAAF